MSQFWNYAGQTAVALIVGTAATWLLHPWLSDTIRAFLCGLTGRC